MVAGEEQRGRAEGEGSGEGEEERGGRERGCVRRMGRRSTVIIDLAFWCHTLKDSCSHQLMCVKSCVIISNLRQKLYASETTFSHNL